MINPDVETEESSRSSEFSLEISKSELDEQFQELTVRLADFINTVGNSSEVILIEDVQESEILSTKERSSLSFITTQQRSKNPKSPGGSIKAQTAQQSHNSLTVKSNHPSSLGGSKPPSGLQSLNSPRKFQSQKPSRPQSKQTSRKASQLLSGVNTPKSATRTSASISETAQKIRSAIKESIEKIQSKAQETFSRSSSKPEQGAKTPTKGEKTPTKGEKTPDKAEDQRSTSSKKSSANSGSSKQSSQSQKSAAKSDIQSVSSVASQKSGDKKPILSQRQSAEKTVPEKKSQGPPEKKSQPKKQPENEKKPITPQKSASEVPSAEGSSGESPFSSTKSDNMPTIFNELDAEPIFVDTGPKDIFDVYYERIFGDVTKKSAAKQFVIGGAAGWATGYVTQKVGKLAAVTVGGTVLLVQVAQYHGIININWTKLERVLTKARARARAALAKRKTSLLDRTHLFYEENFFLATGFATGLLFAFLI